jgi:hypothetical protein
MAKKTSRARQRPVRPIASPAATPQSTPPSGEARAATVSPPASAPKNQVDFASEYRYVVGDLRKMGIIAVAMFVVLFALSFAVR